MDKEFLKHIILDGFTYLEGVDTDKTKNAVMHMNIPSNETIIALYDTTIREIGKEGLAFTDNGIYWKASGSKIDNRDKEVWHIFYDTLKKCTFQFKKTMLSSVIVLTDTDNEPGTPHVYEIHLTSSNFDDFKRAMQQVFSELALINSNNTDEISEQEDIYLSSYISPDGTNQKAIMYYQKLFGKYTVNGVRHFTFNWSWSGFFLSWIYLAYRKAYVEAVIIGVIQLVFDLSTLGIGIIIQAVVMAFLSPYLLFRRYKKHENKMNNAIKETSEKIDYLKQVGGTNKKIIPIIIALGIIIFVAAIIYYAIEDPLYY